MGWTLGAEGGKHVLLGGFLPGEGGSQRKQQLLVCKVSASQHPLPCCPSLMSGLHCERCWPCPHPSEAQGATLSPHPAPPLSPAGKVKTPWEERSRPWDFPCRVGWLLGHGGCGCGTSAAWHRSPLPAAAPSCQAALDPSLSSPAARPRPVGLLTSLSLSSSWVLPPNFHSAARTVFP